MHNDVANMSFTYDEVRLVLCISDRDGDEGREEYWYEGVVKGVEMLYATRKMRSEVRKRGCTSAQEEGEHGES